jgi:TolB-like protein/class 3 adenylate cyclase
LERRLAAILAADMVGYSRLMAADEERVLARQTAHRKELIDPKIAEYGGHIVKTTGDGFLAEFPSVVDALRSAVTIQLAMAEREAASDDAQKIAYRMGINLGDIIIEDDDIYGNGVNVAARLESIAEPGGIFVSRTVVSHVSSKVASGFADLGDRDLKNIPEPVQVFRVEMRPEAKGTSRPASRPWPRPAVFAASVLLLAILGATLWLRPWETAVEPAREAQMAFPLPDKPSIAVLPFANLSGDPDKEYFADGVTDDLISDLSRVSGLFVIARNSVFTYKGKAVRIREVAEELGVRFVLEGSIKRAGDQIRINTQLIDASTGGQVWAERYDYLYADLFALQDEVIGKIVAALSIKLTDQEATLLARRPTENLEAYDFYLRAEVGRNTWHMNGLAEALVNYQKAIALAPDFAEAYSGDARTAVDIWRFDLDTIMPAVVARRRAYDAAERALALAPDSARAYSVLALIQMVDGRHSEAIGSARHAVALDPNGSEALIDLALVLTYAGQHEQAVQAMDKALRLDPNPPAHVRGTHGLVLFFDRQFEIALEAFEQARPTMSSFDLSELLAMTYAQLGRFDEARAEVDELLKRFPGYSVSFIRTIYSYHKSKADLNLRLDSLRTAGLPDWPFGYETRSEDRLKHEEIKALALGRTWVGQDNFGSPFIQQINEDGKTAYRNPRYLLSGEAWVERDTICYHFPGSNVGRKSCHPIYRNPKGSPDARNEYIEVGRISINFFSPK